MTTATFSWFDDGCCDVKYLDVWQEMPASYSSEQASHLETEREQFEFTIGRDPQGSLFHKAGHLLMRYRLFPQDKLSCLGDFNLGKQRWVAVGDRVVHRLHLLSFLGKPVLDIVGMVEINQIIEEPRRYGFSCVSVANHVGRGEVSVNVRWTDSNDVVLAINTLSYLGPDERLRQYRWMRRLYRKAYRAGLIYFKRAVLGNA